MNTVEPRGAMAEGQPVPECDVCGGTEDVTPEVCPMQGRDLGHLCKRCRPDEPGDSFYEGRG